MEQKQFDAIQEKLREYNHEKATLSLYLGHIDTILYKITKYMKSEVENKYSIQDELDEDDYRWLEKFLSDLGNDTVKVGNSLKKIKYLNKKLDESFLNGGWKKVAYKTGDNMTLKVN